jgi:catechol 2,3-dioxygenase-like lactoylglutathione lyase family enzyme
LAGRSDVVIDHVTIRVSDVEASRRFYELALRQLGYGEPYRGDHFFEWEDLSISAARADRPVTRNLHLALLARASRAEVDAWWEAMTDAGHPDDGPSGPRPQYSPDYYGAFVRDPDGYLTTSICSVAGVNRAQADAASR